MTPTDEQPELPLDLPSNPVGRHRGEGEAGGRVAKESDPNAVTWRRVHTTEKCHTCITEQEARIKTGVLKVHAAWPASYIRTEGDRREGLCFIHAAPRRQAEGLRKQRSTDPNRAKR